MARMRGGGGAVGSSTACRLIAIIELVALSINSCPATWAGGKRFDFDLLLSMRTQKYANVIKSEAGREFPVPVGAAAGVGEGSCKLCSGSAAQITPANPG